jgi:NAD-dependent DNA ligase
MTFDQILQLLFASVGRLLAVAGGGAVVAYSIFKWLGKRWLEQQFEKQLQKLKHDQQKELQQLQHDINALFSRISKIHEKEFEVLPRAWQLLHEANGAVFQVVKALKQFPDFDRMAELQFEEFVNSCRLAEFQKSELRGAQDRLKYYEEASFWVELNDAKRARTELNNYLALNSIFMTETLRQQFREINMDLAGVIIDEEVFHWQPHNAGDYKSVSDKTAHIADLFSKIESAVQKRLRYEEA